MPVGLPCGHVALAKPDVRLSCAARPIWPEGLLQKGQAAGVWYCTPKLNASEFSEERFSVTNPANAPTLKPPVQKPGDTFSSPPLRKDLPGTGRCLS